MVDDHTENGSADHTENGSDHGGTEPPMPLPTPNLHGDYRGSCTVCMQGTDSGLAFVGPAEWTAGGLSRLGVPFDEAFRMMREVCVEYFGCTWGKVPVGAITVPVQVCEACAASVGMPVGQWHSGVPAVVQKSPPWGHRFRAGMFVDPA